MNVCTTGILYTFPFSPSLHLKVFSQLLGICKEVTSHFGQQPMGVLHNTVRLMLQSIPDAVQILTGHQLLLEAEQKYLLSLHSILWGVPVVPQHHCQNTLVTPFFLYMCGRG